jgi:multisubunit Na+/H+ antiporter MnhB subunit
MDTLIWAVFDALLVATLLVLAWAALASADLRRGVVLFIGFGLLLALVWGRLRAPDVALAEAAIGAGLSGALLLAALRGQTPAEAGPAAGEPGRLGRASGWLIGLLSVALAAAFGWALVHGLQGTDPGRLAGAVAARLGESGVSNPVTAVLLNFRAYDTLLELAVLLVALLGIAAIGPERAPYRAAGPVFAGLAEWLVPLLIVVGGYLLWVGAKAPGGAFQAGALLAGAGVIVRLTGSRAAGLPSGVALRATSVAGVSVFILVGLGLLLAGRPFLGYPPDWAGIMILAIETAATLTIGVTLVVAFLGGEPAAWRQERPLDAGVRRHLPAAPTATGDATEPPQEERG